MKRSLQLLRATLALLPFLIGVILIFLIGAIAIWGLIAREESRDIVLGLWRWGLVVISVAAYFENRKTS